MSSLFDRQKAEKLKKVDLSRKGKKIIHIMLSSINEKYVKKCSEVFFLHVPQDRWMNPLLIFCRN